MGRILAGADFGSNKTGYLVAEARDGGLRVIERESRFTRLAEGLGRDRRIRGAALLRTLAWCEEMRARLEKLGVERFRAVGTEALRRARNRREVLALIEDVLGRRVEVISGREEGRLTFEGVRSGYSQGPLAVIDIGGGSTEIVLGGGPPRRGEERVQVVSAGVGAVGLTERHGEDWDALTRAVRATLRGFRPRGPLPGLLTLLGGTGANLTMMDLDDQELRDDRIEGHVIERERIVELRRRSAALSPRQRVDRLGLPPQRADIQVAGLAILEAALDHLGIRAVRTTRFALRHGVLRSIAPRGS